MYLPKHFAESDLTLMHALMRENPLATLVTQTAHGLVAEHIPLLLTLDDTCYGSLRGHVARANPLSSLEQQPVLVIFHGPQAYISPGWYASKSEDGRVVPTWNYAVVHAHGVLQRHDEPDWIESQMSALTAQQERDMAAPWAVSDAPRAFTDKLLSAVVGIEISLTNLEGKWKVSQNQPRANQLSVAQALSTPEHHSNMADLIRSHIPEP